MRVPVLVCLLLSFAFVFPWLPNPVSIPGPYTGENAYYAKLDASIWTYLLAWGAKHPNRFYDGNILLPLSNPLVANDPRLTEGLWSIPLFRFFEPVTAWGITMLVGLWTTSFVSWICGRRLTGSNFGGLAFAVLFGFGTFRATHVIHVEGTFIPFLPAALVTMTAWLERQSLFRGTIFAAVLYLALIEYSYSAVALGLTIPPALLYGLWRRKISFLKGSVPFIAAFGATVITLAPVIAIYVNFHRATGLARSIRETDRFSADLTAWITPPGGGNLETHPDAMLWPGLVLLSLAIAGARRLPRELILAGVIAFILSFGTWRLLLWRFGVPYLDFPTPYELLHEFLLPVRGIRAPARLGVIAHVVLAIAATFALMRIPKKVAALLLVLAFAEARWSMTEIAIAPEIADLDLPMDEFAVIARPMGRISEREEDLLEAESLFLALAHGKPTPNGTIATYIPWHESIAAHQYDTEILRRLGVRYVIDGGAVTLIDSPLAPPRTPAEFQKRFDDFTHPHPLIREPDTRVAIIAPSNFTADRGRAYDLPVIVINGSSETLCADGTFMGLGPRGNLRIGIRRFVDEDGARAFNMRGEVLQGLAVLPRDLGPGESVTAIIHGLAPNRRGRYRAHLDILLDGMKWIYPSGKPAATVDVLLE